MSHQLAYHETRTGLLVLYTWSCSCGQRSEAPQLSVAFAREDAMDHITRRTG